MTPLLSFLSGLSLIMCCCWFLRCRTLRYLRYFQQEEYDARRFFRWLLCHRAFDKKGSGILLVAFFGSWLFGSYPPLQFLMIIAAGVALCTVVGLESDPRKQGKITLKLTERATRIYNVSFGVACSLGVILALALPPIVTLVLVVQMTPAYLVVAMLLLQPQEKKRQKKLADEAVAILKDVAPHIIGITGSYGKTSTKNILGQIFQIAVGPTFWPKKSINTVMGNTRDIRMHLKKGYQYAIFEMGAYARGSIKRLCALTPPQTAIITTIGTAHLERFGSAENIYHAKSELAQALPPTGILICNGDDPGARRVSQQYPAQTTLCYGFDRSQGYLDCVISNWQSTEKGTAFTIEWQGVCYEGFVPLHGKSTLSNVAAAFTCACAHGAHPEYVLAAIRTLEPVENRLHVDKRQGVTFVHDAYNSNPIGFASALEVLKNLPGERRILMTPGMIELGSIQENENERLGRTAAPLCDVAIIVGTTNKKSLLAGLTAGGLTQEQLMISPTREHAFQTLRSMQREGDVVLIENDLTDLYENQEKF